MVTAEDPGGCGSAHRHHRRPSTTAEARVSGAFCCSHPANDLSSIRVRMEEKAIRFHWEVYVRRGIVVSSKRASLRFCPCPASERFTGSRAWLVLPSLKFSSLRFSSLPPIDGHLRGLIGCSSFSPPRLASTSPGVERFEE